jgi:hypothetical protein
VYWLQSWCIGAAAIEGGGVEGGGVLAGARLHRFGCDCGKFMQRDQGLFSTEVHHSPPSPVRHTVHMHGVSYR